MDSEEQARRNKHATKERHDRQNRRREWRALQWNLLKDAIMALCATDLIRDVRLCIGSYMLEVLFRRRLLHRPTEFNGVPVTKDWLSDEENFIDTGIDALHCSLLYIWKVSHISNVVAMDPGHIHPYNVATQRDLMQCLVETARTGRNPLYLVYHCRLIGDY